MNESIELLNVKNVNFVCFILLDVVENFYHFELNYHYLTDIGFLKIAPIIVDNMLLFLCTLTLSISFLFRIILSYGLNFIFKVCCELIELKISVKYDRCINEIELIMFWKFLIFGESINHIDRKLMIQDNEQ